MRKSPSPLPSKRSLVRTKVLKLTVALDWLERTIRTIG
jgi:hypothetical protein